MLSPLPKTALTRALRIAFAHYVFSPTQTYDDGQLVEVTKYLARDRLFYPPDGSVVWLERGGIESYGAHG